MEQTQEVIVEHVQKDESEKRWQKPYEKQNGAANGVVKPTERQKAYIKALARNAGLQVDITKIKAKQDASLFIERLKILNRQMHGSPYGNGEAKDKRVAFGMATKLMFRRYCDQQKDPTRWKRFWHDVQQFYKAYQEQQELAVLGDEDGLATV